MIVEDFPKVSFTKWVSWTNRNALEGINHPGVYLLAHFDNQPPGLPNTLPQDIIYIGETVSKLRKRLNKFNRSAFKGAQKHAGGVTYWNLFEGKHEDKLYVSVFPVSGLDEEIEPLFIRYVERKLLLEYGLKWGNSPICNKM